jgi:excisionase family DNA binding protein
VSELSLALPPETVEALAERAAAIVLTRLDNRSTSDAWPEFMNVATAARYLDVSEERIRKLKDRRQIPYYQGGPRCRVSFRRTELDTWMASFRKACLR